MGIATELPIFAWIATIVALDGAGLLFLLAH